jgi:hypothetical protein
MLYVEPLAESSHMSSPSAVLTSLGSDSEALEKYFLVRPTIRGMEYLIPSITPMLGDQVGELHGLLSSFISKGAVEGAKTRTAEGELNWMTFDNENDARIKVLDVLKASALPRWRTMDALGNSQKRACNPFRMRGGWANQFRCWKSERALLLRTQPLGRF